MDGDDAMMGRYEHVTNRDVISGPGNGHGRSISKASSASNLGIVRL